MYMNAGAHGSQQRAPDPTELDFPAQVESLHVDHSALSPMQSITVLQRKHLGCPPALTGPTRKRNSKHSKDHTAGENRNPSEKPLLGQIAKHSSECFQGGAMWGDTGVETLMLWPSH